MKEKVIMVSAKLPSGRELTLMELMKFCYDLSMTDIEVYFKLLKEGSKTIDDLSKELGLSKATISRSLNKLLGLGFVLRERMPSSAGIGRPRYLYKADLNKFYTKLQRDIQECTATVKRFAEEVFQKMRSESLGGLPG